MKVKYNSKLEKNVHDKLLKKGLTGFEVNTYPDWMRSPITRRKLQLDLYCSYKKIAVEIQGPRHNNVKQFYVDYVKKQLCEKQGVKLFYVSPNSISKDIKIICAFYGRIYEGNRK